MENERKATPKQLAYIRHLMKRKGDEDIELDENLNFQEASKMIETLMGVKSNRGQTTKINEPRLRMAMKENFSIYKHYQKEIFGKHREWFKEDVIRTYELFTEIARKMQQRNTCVGIEG